MRDGSLEVDETWLYTGDILGFPRVVDHLPTKVIRKLMDSIEEREVVPSVRVWPGNVFVTKDRENANMALAVKWLRMSYVKVEIVHPETDEEKFQFEKLTGRRWQQPPPEREDLRF
jgi:hypothetical protein